ncbi:Uncharacterized protein PECH_000557 [Penicillium ucsense]|uniref:ABC transporter n=1 Tax=Penicillium ucsense TaxID=2839758 RepID=A0A8J8W1H4_9EURO|nr:Uncharacterized protein PECM_000930 [Penicillium ucsense]KAF7733458.1 Uncharacterized protein PECH_000557 [Penicillium ucsense]
MLLVLNHPCVAAEDRVGPFVRNPCRSRADFTLLFEEVILTLIPIATFFLLGLVRLVRLSCETQKANRSWLYVAKQTAIALHIAIQVLLVIFWSKERIPTTRATIATAVVSLVASILLGYLSHLEHLRSLRPSTVICVFVGTIILVDLCRIRTLFAIPRYRSVASVFAASWVAKLIILVLESLEKRSLLKKDYQDVSPETTASIFNRWLFWWLNGLFWKGYHEKLTVESLPSLDNSLQAASKPEQLKDEFQKANHYRSNTLLWTLLWHYRWEIFEGVPPRVAFALLQLIQPYLVEQVLLFMTADEHAHSAEYAHGLVVAYALVYAGIAVALGAYVHKTNRLEVMIRGSLVSLIYDKTLHLTPTVAADGSAVTLMSTDVERIVMGTRHIHEFYANFIEIPIALWLLARLLGLASIAAAGIIGLSLAVAVPLAMASGEAQGEWLEVVEERIAVTSNVLGAMKTIKMTGLTEVVCNNIRELRTNEIESSFKFRLYTALIISLSFMSSSLAPVFGFGVYAILAQAHDSGTLTNAMAFSALSFFVLIDSSIMSLIDGSEEIMSVINCFQRVQKFLLAKEHSDHRAVRSSDSHLVDVLVDVDDHHERPSSQNTSCVTAKDVFAAWSIDSEPVLKSLNFEIRTGLTTMIVGPVGCGKSTLLKLLLGEIPEVSGTMCTTFANAAYCSQTPWTSFGTVRQNVVGPYLWDQEWYDTVIKACSLETDLQQLPAGDQTKVGVRGSRLSGGQKMRVSLARALYSRERILILDDVLTGLDRETEKAVLDAVFDSNGLIKKDKLTVILSTNSAHHLRVADHVICLDENGKVIEQGSPSTFRSLKYHVGILTGKAKPNTTEEEAELELDGEVLEGLHLKEDDDEDKSSRSASDLSVFVYYFRIIGWPLLLLFILCACLFTFGLNFPQFWLQWWTKANGTRPNEDTAYWVGIYGVLGVLALGSAFIANWVFSMLIVPKTARRFHEVLLDTTMNATTSFVTSTDIGTTTNRFSQDLELVDGELPHAFEMAIYGVLGFIVEGMLVFAGTSVAALPLLPVVMVIVSIVGAYYVRTSRQIRLLDIEAKAPLFSKFMETTDGLISVRAYGWSEYYQRQTLAALDNSQKPFYILYCIQQWLSIVLDLTLAGIAVAVIAIAFAMKGKSEMGLLGISLFNIVGFSGTLQMLVTEWIDLETSLGAVSRIRSYVEQTETEPPRSELESVSASWPDKGRIQISGVSATFDKSAEPVLRDVSLDINAGEKVALCGRTGSGKTSLISTILQLLHVTRGSILVDGVDISRIPGSTTRSRVNTISQQPLFLHGDVRFNANPEGNASDEEIESALRTVNLWPYLESKGGLDAEMSEDMLSQGQQQLFCLARALCKRSTILIIDEATSSVDADTDAVMQKIIRTHFKDHTILAIAHKLGTVLDFDKIAIIDGGHVVAYDTPRALLSSGVLNSNTLDG